jgi:hypothetical protein
MLLIELSNVSSGGRTVGMLAAAVSETVSHHRKIELGDRDALKYADK